MLGNLGGLHAGQERRSDRIALCLGDLATTPLRSTSRPLWLSHAQPLGSGVGHALERTGWRTARCSPARSRPLVEALEPWLREKLALVSQKGRLG